MTTPTASELRRQTDQRLPNPLDHDAAALASSCSLAPAPRFDHVLLQETRRFVSDSIVSLTVGVGRSNRDADIVSPLPLMSDSAPSNFWYERPAPPQLTGAYDLVLNFKASAPLGDGAASNLSAGTVAWEVCGYNVQ